MSDNPSSRGVRNSRTVDTRIARDTLGSPFIEIDDGVTVALRDPGPPGSLGYAPIEIEQSVFSPRQRIMYSDGVELLPIAIESDITKFGRDDLNADTTGTATWDITGKVIRVGRTGHIRFRAIRIAAILAQNPIIAVIPEGIRPLFNIISMPIWTNYSDGSGMNIQNDKIRVNADGTINGLGITLDAARGEYFEFTTIYPLDYPANPSISKKLGPDKPPP